MPARSPYTPPRPVESPQQQTPRLSIAQRLLTPPPTRRLSTQDPGSEPSPSDNPVSLRRKRFRSSTTVRRQLIPSPSTSSESVFDNSQPSTSWALEIPNQASASFNQPSTSWAVEIPNQASASFNQPSTSWAVEIPNQTSASFDQPSTSLAVEIPTSPERVAQNLDEDLRDPEFFIKLFSRIDGPLLHSDLELREKLERYLLKVNLYQENTTPMPGTSKEAGPSNVNFAEAALVVQGSTRIYGKKVDLLFNAAVQLFRLLSTPFEEQEEEDNEEEGPSDTPRRTKNSKKLRLGIENRDLAEDIALVDGMKEGGRIEHKKSSRPRFSELAKNLSTMPPRGSVRFLPPNIPRLVRKTKTLGTNDKEVEKINCRRVPQYGQGMHDARGFIDEYRLNEVIRKPDCMLVEHFVPFELESSRSSGGERNSQTAKTFNLSLCDSGIDSCPSSVYNPVECSDSVIWEGSSIGVCGETDMLSYGDDGFISEGLHEEGISELEEESELDVNKEMDLEVSKETATKTAEAEGSQADIVDTDLGMMETERSGTESSGVFSEHSPIDEPRTASLTEDERVPDIHSGHDPGDETPAASQSEDERKPEHDAVEDPQIANLTEDEEVPESHPEHGSMEELRAANLIEGERVPELHPQADEELDPGKISDNTRNSVSSSPQSPTSTASELKEVEFTPTPRRNKRKLKNFKLPCKLSLLLPEKKKRMGRGTKAAELWRPSQSPCSSVSSHYPQSPASFAPASPDPNSLSHLMLPDDDDDHNEDLDNLSESENEGEYFDPPADGQPQVNYWIQNHQKDLMSADEPTTLSDQVAQWQELMMPRLDVNLQHGPYSHVRYAPVLMELIARNGWPPKTSKCPYTDIPIDYSRIILDRAPPHSHSVPYSSLLDDSIDEPSYQIPCISDIMGSRDNEMQIRNGTFSGFQTPDRCQTPNQSDSLESAFDSLCNMEDSEEPPIFKLIFSSFHLLLMQMEEVRQMSQWTRDKQDWLQSKVKPRMLQGNWDEWAEENDNIELNAELDVDLPSSSSSSSPATDPVLFTTVFSGFRKEEVSRLLFTALHLASQGVVEISSEPGLINSMKLSFMKR